MLSTNIRFYTKIKLFCRYFIKTNLFLDNGAPFGSEYNQLKIQLNVKLLNLNLFNYYLLLTAEINYYLLKPYPTLGRPFKKFSPQRLRATTRNPYLDLQTIGIYVKPDIIYKHNNSKNFSQKGTPSINNQMIDQNLRKLDKTADFSGIYDQDYGGYFKVSKDYIYLNGEKNRPQDISTIDIFSFNHKKMNY